MTTKIKKINQEESKNKKIKHKTITDDYLDLHKEYEDKYGKGKCLVIMEVGAFYETYATDTEGPDLLEISALLNVVRTRKDKSAPEISREAPYMLGFQKASEARHVNTLIANNYTVVEVNQELMGVDSSGKKEFKRNVSNVYSAGTYIDSVYKPDSSYVSCIYIEEEIQKNGKYLMCIGMAGIDTSTGKNYVHESYSAVDDNRLALDETIRFINGLNPKEIILIHNDKENGIDKEELLSYLGMDADKIHYKSNNTIDKKYFKLNYQTEFLKKVYVKSGTINPIEYVELDTKQYAIVSHIVLLDFIYDHNKEMIKNLNIPELFFDIKTLVFGNNAPEQLNVFEPRTETNNKFNCLFKVVNNTSTSMGRRLLRDRLACPIISIGDLNAVYGCNEELITKKLISSTETHLRDIVDIERLFRKMIINSIHPSEFYSFVESLKQSKQLVALIKNKTTNCKKFLPKDEYLKLLDNFIASVSSIYNMDELQKHVLNEINTNIFLQGKHADIDDIINKIATGNDFMNLLSKKLSGLIPINNKSKKTEEVISIKKTDKKGYYLTTSLQRGKLLLQKRNEIKTIDINGYKLDLLLLEFKEQKSNYKIIFPDMALKSSELGDLKDKLNELNKKYYILNINAYLVQYSTMFTEMIRFISTIDYIKSNAKTAVLYNYTKPILEQERDVDSYIMCKQLRHAFVERIISHEYVPCDISIGKELKGILLFGLNSSGKTALQKAIGLAVIMAQAGMFVPARECRLNPYKSLFTRIAGIDNINKGLSSFDLEMLELKSIMKRSDKNTLVIGDEICRSTEHISGNAIVASTILFLHETNSSFIFATHLHEIAEMKRITDIKTIKPFHLSVRHDIASDTLIYDRELKEGSGERIYGITVAKHIIQHKKFIETALEIKNELLRDFGSLLSGKTSSYNSDVPVDNCEICGQKIIISHISNLETHHINQQKDCDENGFVKSKPHIKKNTKSNLTILCTNCHDKKHNGKIDIKGYVMTSSGKKLLHTK